MADAVSAPSDTPGSPLRETPLAALHREAGGRIVPFAGYAMPVQYPSGIIAEHAWTRTRAGLFDVSHMGQAVLVGSDHETVARALETAVPADVLNLRPGQQRYTLLLNEEGGIIDDLMVARPADPDRDGTVSIVVNAATKEADWRHLLRVLPPTIELRPLPDRALVALQGPEAASVLAALQPDIDALAFMTGASFTLGGVPVDVTRSGYTGEDGFEISLAADRAADVWRLLLANPAVRPVGLGARDSLRLEAGLPLYGHDINSETSPVEAGLAWSIPRRRRTEGGFPGQVRIADELAKGPLRRRVGILLDGRAVAREGTDILDVAGELVGKVTSGGFGPTRGAPIAVGYVAAEFAKPGTTLRLSVRSQVVPGIVVTLPFVPHRYRR